MSDDPVVARAKQGDPDAWRELYRAHAGRLVVWLRTRPTGDAASDPEDVAGQAWLVAAEKIHGFNGDTDGFAGWLFGIARNIAGTTRRRSARRRTDPGDDVAAHLPTVADPTLVLDQQAWVREALASLSPRERDAVGLVDGLGFDVETAAAALGMTAVAVRVARHRGLGRLRRNGYGEPVSRVRISGEGSVERSVSGS